MEDQKDLMEMKIYMINGNKHWQDAIDEEKKIVIVAIEIKDQNDPVPIGWKRSCEHLVFEVK